MERIAFALLWLLIFSVPWEKSIQIAGLGTLTKLIGVTASGAAVAVVLMRQRLRPLNAVLVLSSAWVIWIAASLLWSYDRSATLSRAITFVQLLFLLLVIWNICVQRSEQRWLLIAFVAGAAIASLATIVRYSQGWQTYYRRYAAPGFDPNDMGITIAIAIPLALYLSDWRIDRWPWLYRTVVALCCAAILLTASRTALIAAFSGFVYLPLTWHVSTGAQRSWGIVLLLLFLSGALVLAPKESRQRISTIGTELSKGTLHKRTTIWKAGFRAWKSRKFPGVGAGAYPQAVEPLIGVPGVPGHEYVAHNTFLSVLTETGLVGFALFTLLLVILCAFTWVLPDRERSLWAAAILVWGIGAFTLTWEHRKPTWLLFGLITTEWARSFRTDPEP